VLEIPSHLLDQVIAHCQAELPEEACGLLVGPAGGDVVDEVVPAENLAHSTTAYTLDPLAYLRSDLAAEARGGALLGVFHSHPTSEARPSATDISEAPNPGWHYLVVGLGGPVPEVRSWRIVGHEVTEEPVFCREGP
jgi:proteasome lid subunit RPN8/RPN11